ncbi:hypothetical protein ACFLZP_03525 [Patescibacteria group bacterium]
MIRLGALGGARVFLEVKASKDGGLNRENVLSVNYLLKTQDYGRAA